MVAVCFACGVPFDGGACGGCRLEARTERAERQAMNTAALSPLLGAIGVVLTSPVVVVGLTHALDIAFQTTKQSAGLFMMALLWAALVGFTAVSGVAAVQLGLAVRDGAGVGRLRAGLALASGAFGVVFAAAAVGVNAAAYVVGI